MESNDFDNQYPYTDDNVITFEEDDENIEFSSDLTDEHFESRLDKSENELGHEYSAIVAYTEGRCTLLSHGYADEIGHMVLMINDIVPNGTKVKLIKIDRDKVVKAQDNILLMNETFESYFFS